MCVLWWSANCDFYKKFLPPSLHLKGFSPVCVFCCLVMFDFTQNFPQSFRSYDFSPVWVLWWWLILHRRISHTPSINRGSLLCEFSDELLCWAMTKISYTYCTQSFFSDCILWWAVRADFRRVLSHSLSFSPGWVVLGSVGCDFWKDFPHLLLSHGFCLVCVFSYWVRWDSWLKAILQSLHSKIFSPAWVLWGWMRCDFLLKLFSFSLDLWVFCFILTFWCLKRADSHTY